MTDSNDRDRDLRDILSGKHAEKRGRQNGAAFLPPTLPLPLVATKDLRTEIVEITPALAKDWLGHGNPNNRKILRQKVDDMARDMIDGRWTMTHQGIAFTKDGEVSDGHHRLHAVIAANVPIKMMVTYGIPHAAVIDRGRLRSDADARKMAGNPRSAQNYLSALKMIIRCKQDNFNGSITGSELDTLEAEESEVADWLLTVVHRSYPAAVWGALAFAYPVAKEPVLFFSRALLGKEVLQPGSAAMTFASHFNRLETAGAQNMRSVAIKTLTMLKHQAAGTTVLKLVASEEVYQRLRAARGCE